MRETVKFKYKKKRGYDHGVYKVDLRNVSDEHLEDLKNEIGKEQIRRKETKPQKPFGYKLKRFFRRLNNVIQYHAETTVCNYIVGSEQAASINYLGLVED